MVIDRSRVNAYLLRNLLGQAVDAACKVLGHCTALNSLNTHPLQSLGEPVDQQRRLEKAHFIQGLVSFLPTLHVSYLIRSGFPSSLPRCSRPLVQAKMLAMGLVLVGLPWNCSWGFNYSFKLWELPHLSWFFHYSITVYTNTSVQAYFLFSPHDGSITPQITQSVFKGHNLTCIFCFIAQLKCFSIGLIKTDRLVTFWCSR